MLFFLIALLAIVSSTVAQRTTLTTSGGTVYVTFQAMFISNPSNRNSDYSTATSITDCANQAAAFGSPAFEYTIPGQGFQNPQNNAFNLNCAFFSFTSACARQSSLSANSDWTIGMVDRCSGPSNPPGYSMAADGTCIFTQNMPPTTADYSAACSGNAPKPMASMAFKKRDFNPLTVPGANPGEKVPAFQAPLKAPSLCSLGFTACPIASGFECLNVMTNIESCGGCVSALGEGEDCTAAVGVAETSCDSGKCRVESCIRGYRLVEGVCKSIIRSTAKA